MPLYLYEKKLNIREPGRGLVGEIEGKVIGKFG